MTAAPSCHPLGLAFEVLSRICHAPSLLLRDACLSPPLRARDWQLGYARILGAAHLPRPVRLGPFDCAACLARSAALPLRPEVAQVPAPRKSADLMATQQEHRGCATEETRPSERLVAHTSNTLLHRPAAGVISSSLATSWHEKRGKRVPAH